MHLILERPEWPLYDTKRNKEGVFLMKKLVRSARIQQVDAKDRCYTVRVYNRYGQEIGYVLQNGVFYSVFARLAAIVPPGADHGTVDQRKQLVRVIRNQRLRGLNPAPVLP